VTEDNKQRKLSDSTFCVSGAVSKDGISLIHGDSLQALKSYGDNHFDVAIVDPPYGIGEDGGKARTRGSKRTNGEKKGWDNERPNAEYFAELMRVSKNQIIWGGNYFADLLPASRCWLYWQKNMGGDFADGELAWTSFDKVLKQYTKRSETFDRIHPTQKPVQLYKWLLENYTSEGDLILDTHLGSGSIALACHYMKRRLVGYEIDAEYYEKACKRFEEQTRQIALW
jgi:site-specific DNA-methyltransferase (adenine-specific)